MSYMTAIEHKELKGITIRNMVVTITSTASIVAAVMTTYFNLQSNISDIKNKQETTERVNEIRLKVLEGQVAVLQQEVQELQIK